jgi:hypothetical protein
MNPQALNSFLANFGIHHGEEVIVSPGRYAKIVRASLAWFGEQAAQMVSDCFLPVGSKGESVDGSYHGTVWYAFEYPTLQEIEFIISPNTHSH